MAYWSQYAINMLVYSVTSKPYRQAYKLLYTDMWKEMTVAQNCTLIKRQKAPDIVIYMDIKLIPRRARNVIKWNENDIFHTLTQNTVGQSACNFSASAWYYLEI